MGFSLFCLGGIASRFVSLSHHSWSQKTSFSIHADVKIKPVLLPAQAPFLFPLWKVTEPGECLPVGALGEKSGDSIPLASSVEGLALSTFFTLFLMPVKQELAHLLLNM